MGRFSLSPPSDLRDQQSPTLSRGLPYRDNDDQSSDNDSQSCASDSSFSEEEEPHPLGFGKTRFTFSPPPAEPSCCSRFVFEDSDDEMDAPSWLPELNKEASEQSFPMISSYINPYTASTTSLLRYSGRQHDDDGDGERMDRLSELLHASTVVDNEGGSRWLTAQAKERQDVGEKMWALAKAANRDLEEIQEQAKLERLRVAEQQRKSADSLRRILERDQKDAQRVILREKKEKEAQREAEKKKREQEAEEAAEEERRNEQEQREKKAEEDKAKQAVEASKAAARAKEKKAQDAKAKKTEYVTRADRLVAKLVEVRKSVEPFEKLRVPLVSKRRLDMKKTVRGKINTLSHDAIKVKAIAADVAAQISEARAQDEQIKQQLQSGSSSELTSEMTRGKRYLLDLLASNVVVRIQAESFLGLKGDGFPLAAMLAAVSVEAKDMMPILAAHIYTVCPMAIPKLPRPSADSSEAELMLSLGMTENETFEKFLGRTGNTISMVAAIMASKPSNHGLLGGHKGAVDWLERFIALLPPPPDSPLPLLTAPVLDAFLTGAGNMLANKYPEQFKKHLDIIKSDTVNRLDVGTIGQPSATRLKKLVSGGFEDFKNNLPPGAIPELYDGSSLASGSTFSTSAPICSSVVSQTSTAVRSSPFGSGQTTSVVGTSSSGSPSTTLNSSPFGSSATPAAPLNNPFGATGQKGTSGSGSFEQSMNTESSAPASASSPFGAPSQSNTQSAFSQGTSNSMMTSTPFGSSSSAAPFGSPTLMSGNNTSPFGGGGPSSSKSPFGSGSSNPSPFGGGNMRGTSAAPTPSPFGVSASAGGASPFGGGVANASTPFGASGGSTAFGSSSGPTNTGLFGLSGAGQSAFGGQSYGNTNTMQSTPFGGAASQSAPFGMSAQPTPFGGTVQSTPFGGVGNTASTPFGNTSQNSATGGNSYGGGKKSNRPCRFFAEGRCRNGANCRFSHETGSSSGANPFGGSSTGGSVPFSGTSNPFGGPRR